MSLRIIRMTGKTIVWLTKTENNIFLKKKILKQKYIELIRANPG